MPADWELPAACRIRSRTPAVSSGTCAAEGIAGVDTSGTLSAVADTRWCGTRPVGVFVAGRPTLLVMFDDGRCAHCSQVVAGVPGHPTPTHRKPGEQGACPGSGQPLQPR